MTLRDLERVIDLCIDDIAAGRRTVAECMEAYPEHRAELSPLLEAAFAVHELPRVPERPVDPVRRARFMAELRRTPQQSRSRLPRRALPSFGWGAGLARMAPRMVMVAAPAAAIALLAIVFTLARPGAPAAASTLTVFSGAVEVARDGSWTAADDGAQLAEGAHLRTSADGRALVTFSDGSTAALEPHTELVLERVHMDGAREISIDQRSGRIWNDVASDDRAGSAYVVRTPDAVVRALGTVFETAVEDGETAVSTAEGTVEVQTDDEQVQVAPGELLRLAGRRVTERVKSDPAGVSVQAPFVASLVAEHGAATGARTDGVVFRQLAGVMTTDPGEAPQEFDLMRAAPGIYTLLLRRFAEGAGEVVIETPNGKHVLPVEANANGLAVRVRVELQDGRSVLEVLGHESLEEARDELRERVVETKRSEQARPVAERRGNEGRGQGAGRGNDADEGPSEQGRGRDRNADSDRDRDRNDRDDQGARRSATPASSDGLADRLRDLLTATAGRPATPPTPPASRTPAETVPPPAPTITVPTETIDRVARLLLALDRGDRETALSSLRLLAERPDPEVAARLRAVLADERFESHRDRLRELIGSLSDEHRERLRRLLLDGGAVPGLVPGPLPTLPAPRGDQDGIDPGEVMPTPMPAPGVLPWSEGTIIVPTVTVPSLP
jgi:hypothetical protein